MTQNHQGQGGRLEERTGSQSGADAADPRRWTAKLVAGLRRWAFPLRILVSAVLVYVILQQVSLSELGLLFKQTLGHPVALLIAVLLPGLGIFISVLRWRVLMGGLGARPRIVSIVKAFLVGSFFNYLLPSTIGGDLMRSWWMERALGSTVLSLTVVALDRLIGLFGICAVSLIAAALHPSLVRDLPQFWIIAAIVLMGAVALTALGHPAVAAASRRLFTLPFLGAVRHKLALAYDGLASLRHEKLRLIGAFLLSIALQLVIVVAFFVFSYALEAEISLWALAIVVPIVSLISMLPITINGIGLRETALAVLGAGFGLTTENAIAMGWMFLGANLVYALLGGLFYAAGRSRAD